MSYTHKLQDEISELKSINRRVPLLPFFSSRASSLLSSDISPLITSIRLDPSKLMCMRMSFICRFQVMEVIKPVLKSEIGLTKPVLLQRALSNHDLLKQFYL